ncbi:hypothetical protein VCRA2121O157_50110 [Vibrio crassostreae]|nr:hypothetical protein VCRA2113O137_40205 [Vibrio crassostreae]CAK2142925.1 hypothetical protein VCRA2113O138_50109 [Vibrio crassostreae]CAK2149223.1 hypothetical protein VCRA2113O140_50207 [Vibrio crassostreae]CAK2354893.1 hypothetical protein VCRA2116O141_50205 [Vibrio crassostreae]CAK3007634.1 hypothetical protein VCRA2113O139_50110 [Vibrio crassostreae]
MIQLDFNVSKTNIRPTQWLDKQIQEQAQRINAVNFIST